MRLALIVGAFAAAGACGAAARTQPAGIRDDYGDTVDTVAATKRIVSLNPTITELLFALGAGRAIVGRSRWDHWPAAALDVPEVGDAIRPSVERVLAARPDLVVLYASNDNQDAARALTAAGIRVAAFRGDRIADFARIVSALGALTHTSSAARALVDSVSRSLEHVRRASSGSAPRPRVFLHVWDNPLMTLGAGSFMSELVEIAGGANVYGDRPEPSLTISFEDLVARDPDAILLAPAAAARLTASGRWTALRAVREGHVLVYDTTIVGRPSVGLGAAAHHLATLLRPLRAAPAGAR